MDADELSGILKQHAAWLSNKPGGVRADLSRADLSGADLDGANFSRVDLSGSDLRGATLWKANLWRADLRGAHLSGADFSGAILPTGETWEAYCAEVVPALLAAGGHLVSPEAWNCHDWQNCPMAEAFGVSSPDDTPLLYRPRIAQFTQFFDAGLLSAPVTPNG